MAGGTGGHIFPALAVAEILAARGWRVTWMGAKSGMEARIVARSGYEMRFVDFQGVRGKGPLNLALLPYRLLRAFWQSAAVIRALRPDVVLGMGGYISFPGGMMASALNRPLVIHEQNSIAGTSTRLLAQIADRVLASDAAAFTRRRRVVLTGNPIRSAFTSLPTPQARFARRSGPLRITVLGGSLGAKPLNDVVPRALAALPHAPQVLHQAGEQHIEAVVAGYREAGLAARCVAFVEDVAAELMASDLVICRAGATTLAELTAVGVGAILVPFPFAIDDHQMHNARRLAQADAAIVLPQAELTPQRLSELIAGLDRARLLDLACAARALGNPDAAHRVAEVCIELAEGARR
ncbi:MAG: undecaprenyldiphospho-muramoylpentapeptide beta-N-acetylglucosaminyltransferase [Burkholderiales bacterium]|nr:undecaprenyldiphospho-muramoylpentapeptide beta-N-acetylglucosaminyltransferase [Burkholderiales bacterium]